MSSERPSVVACAYGIRSSEFFMLISFLLASSLISPDTEFVRLRQILENYDFEVRLELPPRRGAYGLLQHSSKTIWINPVVF